MPAVKFRQAASAANLAPPLKQGELSAGQPPPPSASAPSFGMNDDSSSYSGLMMSSPPPSSTKKKNGGGGKRSKLHSPLMSRSPLGFLSPNDGPSSARKLSFAMSPTVDRIRRKSKASAAAAAASGVTSRDTSRNNRAAATTPDGFQIYSPSPTKQRPSSMASSLSSGIVSRASMSAGKVKGSLRKDRKRYKAAAAAATPSSASFAAAVDAANGHMEGDAAPLQDEAQVEAAEFVYPTEAVAIPGPRVIKCFHGLATATATAAEASSSSSSVPKTHQAQLDELGTRMLSLEDVVIPSSAHEENAAVKFIQAKLQREPDVNAVAIRACVSVRAYVLEMASLGATSAKTNRLHRETEFRQELRRRAEVAKAERFRVREVAKAEREKRRHERQVRKKRDNDRIRIKAKKNHPRNKELWREVATLMKEVAKLQKEERMWNQASGRLDDSEKEVQKRLELAAAAAAKDDEEEQTTDTSMIVQGREAATNAEASTSNAIDDIITSVGRIDTTLKEVAELMENSGVIRRELYGKYTSDHQFHGYRGSKDTKGLIVALSQG
eukprot:CAMPEP_0178496180 /NCGR_PEP_ID=MMETSP0696-20121128/13970_1 /TAXON_ID=265572 /ORGANISM="Extubocellulus spinifer, Strain CCMP396" /LENGTH=552 /DNA_ID=CAMNT_0020124427 /DNA_START=27 /DNA_END=1685 /DNA_ORIENTATION=+